MGLREESWEIRQKHFPPNSATCLYRESDPTWLCYLLSVPIWGGDEGKELGDLRGSVGLLQASRPGVFVF